jgi:iron complex outermembrane receptor protein
MSCIERVDSVWTEHAAVFFNTEMDVTDQLSLTLGLRSGDDRKRVLQDRYDRTGARCCGFEAAEFVRVNSSNTDRMFSLAYKVTDQILAYGSYQEGYRGGGTTARPTATTRIGFGPETLENTELGFKSNLLDERLLINAAVFDMTYRNIQRNAAGVDELGQLAFVTTNAGVGSISGFELEAQLTIGAHWAMESSIGHVDYELTDLRDASPEALLAAGLTVSNAADINDGPSRTPEYTVSLNVGYFTSLNNGAGLSLRYGVSWRDDVWWGVQGDTNDTVNFVPAHALSNFRMTWASADREWEAALFCTNCTNERTTSSRLNFLSLTGHFSETYIRPAEWGLSAKRLF